MTPQERAAAIAEQIVKALDVHPSPINIDAVLPWVQQTRRAALLDAAKLVGDYNCMHNHGKKATKACDDLFDELTKLAQEG